jgi:hypothetical protein
MDDSIVLNRTEAYNLQTLLAFNISHLKCHLYNYIRPNQLTQTGVCGPLPEGIKSANGP